MKTNAIFRVILICVLTVLAGCSPLQGVQYGYRANTRLPGSGYIEPMSQDTAFLLYRQIMTSDYTGYTVSQRHRQVAGLYSRRVNALFERWEVLDRKFQKLRRAVGDRITIASANALWWNSFTSPVLGCDAFTDSIKFTFGNRVDAPITIDYKGSGPQGVSTTWWNLKLHFIEEDDHLVVDQVEGRQRFRHSYLPQLNYDKRLTLDDYIADRCQRWEWWITEIETYLKTGERPKWPGTVE